MKTNKRNCMSLSGWLLACGIQGFLSIAWGTMSHAQIPTPDDAPLPLSTEVARSKFVLPDGFQMEVLAEEPTIQEPSGIAWDERGRLFVTELHGFNLEGQFDVEEWNRTGKLDRIPRRIPASDQAKELAKPGIYGTVKLLLDQDGDGKYESFKVWANDLPPCYGAVPTRGGILVCFAPEIVFLADLDGDNEPEVRETLFSDLPSGEIDRGISNPQWGPDGWIYFGRGHRGGVVTGRHLAGSVALPHSDFRIRPDGTAIEPVVGSTYTFGFAFTGLGDRLVPSTRTPAIWVAPLDWNALNRNPYVASTGLEINAADYQEVYPSSRPHPWRQIRSEDPGFSKFYTERYGKAESTPNGYFTSACSPLVYQDHAIASLKGMVLTCEPAQNLIHRSQLIRHDSRLMVERPASEKQSEFLTTTDSWFHPIALSHSPDGSIAIVDFYREIIEDYSAIPRYLQQIYGVVHGKDRGRIWRLTHRDQVPAPNANLFALSNAQLVEEISSPLSWRRETAKRLLHERGASDVAESLLSRWSDQSDPYVAVNLVETLEGLGQLTPNVIQIAMKHRAPEVRRLAVRLASRFPTSVPVFESLLRHREDDPMVRLQLAETLGDYASIEATDALWNLAAHHENDAFMTQAILGSVGTRCGAMLRRSLAANSSSPTLGKSLIDAMSLTVGARGDAKEVETLLGNLEASEKTSMQAEILDGIAKGTIRTSNHTTIATEEIRVSIGRLAHHSNRDIRLAARRVEVAWKLESDTDRRARLATAIEILGNAGHSPQEQLDAVDQLRIDDDSTSVQALLAKVPLATPVVREAILQAILSRKDAAGPLFDALERKEIPASTLSRLQREVFFQSKDSDLRRRAKAIFNESDSVDLSLLQSYQQALTQKRDLAKGAEVFRQKCSNCHHAHGVGQAIGPDLTAEFQRSEEALIRDLLLPSETIAAGYASYVALTQSGQVYTGIVTAETPTSVSVLLADGKEQILLRRELEELRVSKVSMMPDDLAKTVSPRDFADVIGWLRQPSQRLVLLDEDDRILFELSDGDGDVTMVSEEPFSGKKSLRVDPLQRSNASIHNWQFRIREHPVPGEYRFLRLAWRAPDAKGVMIEIARNRQWPPAKSAIRRYFAGENLTGWNAVCLATSTPRNWTTITIDLWKESGDFELTGMAPTAMGGPAFFDRIELLSEMEATDSNHR